jgi:hypothetical protein
MSGIDNSNLLENLFYNIMMNIQDQMDGYENEDEHVVNQSLYDSSPIKMVISDEEKNKLIPIKYKDALHKEQNITCFITQDDFQEEDDIIQLPCNHCFTPDSIMHWLIEECAECPVCRHKFDSVEKRVVSNIGDDLPELIEIENPNIQNNFDINNNIFLNNFINNVMNDDFFQDQLYYDINDSFNIDDVTEMVNDVD